MTEFIEPFITILWYVKETLKNFKMEIPIPCGKERVLIENLIKLRLRIFHDFVGGGEKVRKISYKIKARERLATVLVSYE